MNPVLYRQNSSSLCSRTHYPISVDLETSQDAGENSNHDTSWEESISPLFSNCSDSQIPYNPMDIENSSSDTATADLDALLSPSLESAASSGLFPFSPFSDMEAMVDSFSNFPFSLEGGSVETNHTLPQQIQQQDLHTPSMHIEESQEQFSSISISEIPQSNRRTTRPTSAKPPPGPQRRSDKSSEEIARTRSEIRRARAARNRASARRSRLRKKAESQREMERATSVQRQHEDLKRRVTELRDKAESLRRVALALGLTNNLTLSGGGSDGASGVSMPHDGL